MTKLFKLVPWQPHGVLAIECDAGGKPEALAATWYGEEVSVREWVSRQGGAILGESKYAGPPCEHLRVVALTNDRAQLIAHDAAVDDRAAADALRDLYLPRGLIVRYLDADSGGLRASFFPKETK